MAIAWKELVHDDDVTPTDVVPRALRAKSCPEIQRSGVAPIGVELSDQLVAKLKLRSPNSN